MASRRPRPGRLPLLPFGNDGGAGGRTVHHLWVTIQPDRHGSGYAIFDMTQRRVFGGLCFSTPDSAEDYLEDANRRSQWLRWRVKRAERARRRRKKGQSTKQLSLF